jgi:hypothetical protein
LISKILLLDAIAFFISPKNQDSTAELGALLNSPFISTEAVVAAAMNAYQLIGITNADGDFFRFFSSEEAGFALLKEPLASAVEQIQSSDWYRENLANLEWDGEYSMCLVQE